MNIPADDKQPTSSTQHAGRKSQATPKLNVGREIADTTWRMTVPVVLFAFIGIFLDLRFDSAPWLTFVGVIIGFYFAVLLIKKQINRSQETS